MLGENNLRETGVRKSVANIDYESFNSNSRSKCSCDPQSVRHLLCYCFGITFYAGSCAASFYAGYSYEKLNYNSTLF